MASWIAEANQILDPADFFGGQASRQASEIQLALGRLGLGIQQEFFDQLRQDQAPVRTTRDAAIAAIANLDNGGSLPASPGLEYQQRQAQDNIRAAMAAGGKFNSGGRYAYEQDALSSLASQDQNQSINRLLNLAGFQTGDLINSNQLLQNNVNSQSQQLANQGAVRASGIMGQFNAFNNLLGNASGFAGLYGNRLFNNQSGSNTDYGAQQYNTTNYAGFA